MEVAVYLRTYAHYTTNVVLSDEELADIARDLEKPVEDLTADDIRELAEDKVFKEGVPGLCSQEVISLSDWESPDATDDAVEIVSR